MDVHTPKRPIHSVREFARELVTITAGVLIALALEGLVGWHHDNALVREARQTIAHEIADNKRELDGSLASWAAKQQDIDTALKMANDVLATGRSKTDQISLQLLFGDLSASAWQTAERTGALSHMSYEEVEADASVYGLQDLLVSEQRTALARLTTALAFVEGVDPTRAPASDLRAFREQVLNLRAEMFVLEQLGHRLSSRYAKVMSQHPE